LIWDFAVVEQTAGHLEVLVTAAKSDALQAVCAALESAGMRATAISSANLELYHSYQFNYADAAERVLLVDIGARTTQLLFVDQTHYFSRTLPFGGNAITQSIAEALRVSFGEAEELKIELHSTQDSRLTHSESWRAVQQAIDQFGMRLHGEMIRSTANLRGALIGQPAKIYVAGGGSHMDSLVAALAKRNDRPAYLFSPLRQVALMPAVVARGSLRMWPQLSQLVGLAIGINGKRSPSADLLPPSAREEMEFRRRRPMLIATALLVAIAILPAVFYYRGRARAAEKQSAEIALTLKPMRDRQVRDRELVQQIERLRTRIDALNGVAETRTNWQRFLKDIQDRMTRVDDVWLDSLAVQRDDAVAAVLPGKDGDHRLRLLLSGRLLDRANPISKVSAESYERVKQLISSFSSSDFVASVERERFDNHQPGILRFDLTLVVQPQKNL
jgi:type IV pilus assembly protein PilM